MEEQQVKMAMQGLSNAETGDRALDAQRILELANKAYSLYVSQDSTEKAKLLRMLFLNCLVDAVSVTPTYRKPFDMIVKRAQFEEWSGREDSNLRPPGPEPGALPDCATPRTPRKITEAGAQHGRRAFICQAEVRAGRPPRFRGVP
jgi:hypothetical protein